jgi:uncharacterized cysteine cluster protein YcgN (CxxCxxCC family)
MAELRTKFWEQLSLEQLNEAEWEALCDGCGLCCLVKLEDEDTEQIYFTNLVCTLLDGQTCRCSDYQNRHVKMPDCRAITLASLQEIEWLPPSCAYRLREEGKPLFPWHPLVSGNLNSVHEAGISTRGWTVCESSVSEDDYEDYLVASPFGLNRNKSKK